LLHPDFAEIYTYLKCKGVLVAILTNAALMRQEHLNLFAEYKPYKIEVSIYGVNSTFSNNDQTGNAFKVLENILKLKKMGINVIAKTPYNTWTAHEFDAIQFWCKINEVEFYYSDELFNGYDGTDTGVFRKELPDKISSVENGNRLFQYKKIFDCPAGKYSFILSHDGYIRPCFAFYRIASPEWNFSIDEKGICEAYSQMKEKIESVFGNRLKYCHGCNRSDSCQECLATQYFAENLEEYMIRKCENNNT
jgi:MoaA/NifB/PqqE/SkfB family radical SAM enzyme